LSEKQVADLTIRYCTIFLARGGERIFLHSGCTGSVNKPGTESCLFADGAVRKAFAALAVFSEVLGARPRFMAEKLEAGIYVFAFESNGKAVILLWDPEGNGAVTIPSGVACLDLMGREVITPTTRLGDSPIYWIAPLDQVESILDAFKRVTNATPAPRGTIGMAEASNLF
jgi:hypothetical protein